MDKSTARLHAVHEAGHAVAHIAVARLDEFGMDPKKSLRRITLFSDRSEPGVPKGDGHCDMDVLSTPASRATGICDMTDTRALSGEAIATIAGPLAEARYLRKSFWPIWTGENCVHDREMVRVAFDRCGVGATDRPKIVALARQLADELLSEQWRAVLALADALQVAGELDGVTAVDIVDAAMANIATG